MPMLIHYCSIIFEQSDWPTRSLVMLSQQDQEMRRNVPDPSFVGGSHFCGSGAGNKTSLWRASLLRRTIDGVSAKAL